MATQLMRVGIDARELCGRATGVGRYLAGLLTRWRTDAQGHEFVLYAPSEIGLTLDARRFVTRMVPGAGGTWWEQVDLPRAARRDHLDVLFAPAYTAPLRFAQPLVVAVHDLSFLAHPEWFSVREGARRRWLVRHAARKASAVITISQFSRTELIDRLGLPSSHVHVIPPGVSAPPGRSASRPSGLVKILYVGSVFNRRHVVDLIRAFAPIARSRADVWLDIAGENRTYPREDLRGVIAAEGVAGRVQWHEYVSDDQLRALYDGARAFAFLSEYEGLGLPPLEALAAGVPPVLLDTAVARESCGAAAIYVPTGSLPAITAALERALFDDAERARILAAAPAELAKYDWTHAAAETLKVLEGAVRA